MDEEVEPGVMAVAAPIRDFRGEVVAAVNVTGARARLAPRIHAVAQQVLASAAALSLLLGFGASPDHVTEKSDALHS
jgi:IclR family pca regulon transcriptional regulator